MGLKGLIDHFRFSEYRPHTLITYQEGVDDLFLSLSVEAQVFLWHLRGNYQPGQPTLRELYGKRWADESDLLNCFHALPSDSRVEVLGLLSIYLHELTHHIDFMITPFGANFHFKACLEYIAFFDFSSHLLLHPELIPNGRLVDFQDMLDMLGDKIDPQLSKYWTELVGKIMLFDSYRLARADKIEEIKVIELFGKELTVVTVHGFLHTVAVPNNKGWYLRPLTILETHALIHSLKWIVYQLGFDSHRTLSGVSEQKIKDELNKFLETFYPPEEISPDYTFLLELFANLWGKRSFALLIDEMPLINLNSVFIVVDAMCWYALHSTPPTSDDSVGNSSPTFRLLTSLIYFQDEIRSKEAFSHTTGVEFLNSLDNSAPSRKMGFRAIEQNLKSTLELISEGKRLNRHNNRDLRMFRYFDYLFSVLEAQVSQRMSHGYNSHLGMPEYGDPLSVILQNERDVVHFLDEYPMDAEVLSWFRFRENFFFKYMNPLEIRRELLKRF